MVTANVLVLYSYVDYLYTPVGPRLEWTVQRSLHPPVVLHFSIRTLNTFVNYDSFTNSMLGKNALLRMHVAAYYYSAGVPPCAPKFENMKRIYEMRRNCTLTSVFQR